MLKIFKNKIKIETPQSSQSLVISLEDGFSISLDDDSAPVHSGKVYKIYSTCPEYKVFYEFFSRFEEINKVSLLIDQKTDIVHAPILTFNINKDYITLRFYVENKYKPKITYVSSKTNKPTLAIIKKLCKDLALSKTKVKKFEVYER